MTDELDLGYNSVDGIDDADHASLLLLIKDRTSGDYGWHLVYRHGSRTSRKAAKRAESRP
jgi:hypothetical protein